MEQMASKVAAKKLMSAAGVPVLAEVSPSEVTEDDLPLLVKASAGGGGRGMRVVRSLDDVAAAVEQASAEAASAFGDPTVFCEPYVETGRHVEVQIWGDAGGTEVAVLGARDCSVQRRHQKVVEEAPPPGLSEQTLQAMYDAARAAGHAIGYVGVGTVEFLLDPSTRRFWFLEMNTRLQVEHPVTECVTGADLVELQVMAAEGRKPVVRPGERGHAVEVRLYAEDPARDYQPQSGRLTRFSVPGVAASFERAASYGLRVDAGFEAGDRVGTHYDAMLAKVVCHAPTRPEALRRLASALERAEIHGVRTNRDLLVEVLRHEAFVAADLSTDFLARHHLAALTPRPADREALRLSAFAAAVALAERAVAARGVQHAVPAGWRNVTSQPQRSPFTVLGEDGDEDVVAEWYGGRDGYRSADGTLTAELSGAPGAMAVVRADKSAVRVRVYVAGAAVDVESSLGHVALTRRPRFVDPAALLPSGSLLAPMPGAVVRIDVGPGATVVAGQPVLVLEAMKMQHTVTAPYDGVVTEIPVDVGSHVAAAAVLAVVQSAATEESPR
jgi:propionyl-CoA carboxylase alpha chain